jgi:UDP-glucose:(heptosyl)LPS alpha-1,3-glucosyltransferase
MRISLPIDVWDPGRGGAEKYLDRLAAELAKRGHEVTFLCLEARDGAASERRSHVEVLRAPRFPRWLREIRFAEACVRSHREAGRDVLFAVRHALEADVYQPHGGSLRAARAGAASALPAWRRVLRNAVAGARPSLRVLLRLDHEVFIRSPRVVTVSVSEKVERDFRTVYPGLEFHFERIANPVDTDRLHDRDRSELAAAWRSRFGIPAGRRIAAFAAHRFRPKGLEPALRALARAGDWHVVVAGRDRASPFERVATRLRVSSRVHFAGAVADMRRLLAGADALIHPTYYDPCSLAVLEAMACGTPAITTRQNGASELISHGVNGFIVESPAETEALASALAETARRWDELHRAATSASSKWGWESHVERLEKVLLRAGGRH